MAKAPYDKKTAEKLLSQGKITQKQFDKICNMQSFADGGVVQPEASGINFNWRGTGGFDPNAPKTVIDPTATSGIVPPEMRPAPAPPPVQPAPEIVNTSASVNPAPQEYAVQQVPQVQPSPYDMGVFDMFNKPFDMQKSAVKKEYEAGAKAAAEEAGYLKTATEENDRMIKDNQAKQLKDQANMEGKLAEIQGMKVDPNRYWASKSTGEKILAGIALFLGAAGSGGNKAAAVIQDAINKDIKLQEGDIENKFGLYKQAYAATKDAAAAREGTRLAMLNGTQMKLAEIMSRYKDPMMKAKGEQLMAAIEGQKQAAQINLAAQIQKSQASPFGDDKQMARYVPGQGMAYTPDDAKQLKEAQETKDAFDRKIQEMIDLRKEYGGEVMNRVAVDRGKQLSKDLLLAYKNMAKLGVLSQADEDIINAIIPSDPLAFQFSPGGDSILNRLEKFKTDVQKDYQSKLQNRIVGYKRPEEGLGAQQGWTNGGAKTVNTKAGK